MKLDRRPPPKNGFLVRFSPVYRAEIGQLLHFFHRPNPKLLLRSEDLTKVNLDIEHWHSME